MGRETRSIMTNQTIIYSADSQVKQLSKVFRSMLKGMIGTRYISYRLFIKDVRADYSKSIFGLLWDFLDPLVMAIIFYFLMRMRVVNPGEMKIPYAVFVIFGFLIYQTFMESVTMPLESSSIT